MISTHDNPKRFDCVALKRAAQERIYQATQGMTPEEEIAFFRRSVRSGPLAELWRSLEKDEADTEEPGRP